MNLYITVYEILDGEADWVFHIAKEYPSDTQIKQVIINHIKELWYDEESEAEIDFKDTVGNYWTEQITDFELGDYVITLKKKGE